MTLKVLGRFGLQLGLGIAKFLGSLAALAFGYGLFALLVFLAGKLGHFVLGFTPWATTATALKPELQSTADMMLGLLIVIASVLLYGTYVMLYVFVLFVRDSWRKAIAAVESSRTT